MNRRWIISAGTMLAVYGMVATTAFAIFVPQARLQGLGFRTTNLALKVAPDSSSAPTDSSFQNSISFAGASQMYPGMPTVKERFWVYNGSETGQRLRVELKSLPGDQDWEALKYMIQVNILDLDSQLETGLITLGELVTLPMQFPTVYLQPNEKRRIEFQYTVPENYGLDPDGEGPLSAGAEIGEEAIGKTTSGVSFLINGEVSPDL